MKTVKENFLVSRVFGAFYEIFSPEWGVQRAVLRGKLRLGTREERHPIAIGDRVTAEGNPGSDWIIQDRWERKSALTRKSDTGDTQVLVANADLVAILASLGDPVTKEGFIDRCLASVSISGMEPVVVFTKADLVSPKEIEEKTSIYQKLGIQTFAISTETRQGLKELESFFEGKTVFFSGNSGVGKSTLLNALTQKEIQKTNRISEGSKKGKHTTTNSHAIFLEKGTVLIDSPGIKEWGILHLTPEQIVQSFPEIRNNPDAEISESRQKSLQSMLESLEYSHRITRRDHWNSSDRKRS